MSNHLAIAEELLTFSSTITPPPPDPSHPFLSFPPSAAMSNHLAIAEELLTAGIKVDE